MMGFTRSVTVRLIKIYGNWFPHLQIAHVYIHLYEYTKIWIYTIYSYTPMYEYQNSWIVIHFIL